MLRTILLLIALLIVIAIALVYSGLINITRTDGSVSVETRDVEVGTTVRNVELPVVRMENRQVELPRVGLEDENSQANAQ